VAANVVEIVDVKRQVWPDETADSGLIAAAVAEPGHVTHVALVGDSVVGFVDGFVTCSGEGIRRWEVDLLAVIADQRGRGIGRGLVAASTQAGRESGAQLARALIGLDNIASQRALQLSGYEEQDAVYELHVLAGAAVDGGRVSPEQLHLVRVATFNYRGVWLEPASDAAAIDLAHAVLPESETGQVGMLVPVQHREWAASAQTAGFDPLGRYRWWSRTL